MENKDILQLMLPAVVRAGKAIRQIPVTGCNPMEKADQTPVTAADLASNLSMKKWLSLRDPQCPYISEESEDLSKFEIARPQEYWLADPLDGTSEYLAGNEEYGVCLARISKGSPVAGAILLPAKSELFWGTKESGAFRARVSEPFFQCENGLEMVQMLVANSSRLKCRGLDQRVLAEPIKVLCSRRHSDVKTEEHISRLPNGTRFTVGACLKFVALVLGDADYYPRLAQIHEWDIAAGHAILLAAGGSMKRFGTDQEVIYGQTGFLAPCFQAFG